jgi:hypothetical protein
MILRKEPRVTSQMASYEEFVNAVIVFEEGEDFRETRKPDLIWSGLHASMEVCGFPRRHGLPSQSAGY